MFSLQQYSFQILLFFQISTFAPICNSLDIKQTKAEIYTNNHEDCQEGEYQGIIRISKVSSIFHNHLIVETI